MRYQEVEKILKANGWCFVRKNGSHAQFRKVGESYVATVPEHKGKTITIGVLKSLMRGTGLSFGK